MAVKKASAARKPKAAAPKTAAKAAPAKAEVPAESVARTAPAVAAPAEAAAKVEAAPSKAAPAAKNPFVMDPFKMDPFKMDPFKMDPFKMDPKAAFAGYGDLAAANQETLDAVVKAGSVMARGMESFSKELMTFAQASAEANAAVATRMFGVKSLQEAIDLQNAHARDSFDKAVAETSKLTEMSVKVANEAFEPLQARVNVAVEKLLKSPAA